MISFQRLGNHGRLGNQLFQYAYLRTMAERLGVPFYCPQWIGDKIFTLNDQDVRAGRAEGISLAYREPHANCGFNADALEITDGTDVAGCFQSAKYFDRETVMGWYTFQEEPFEALRKKYAHIPLADSTGVHLRFGDMADNLMYVNLPSSYYLRALRHTERKRCVAVFSDDAGQAKERLKGVERDLCFIEGNEDYEDLFLMARCRDFVCSVSTLSWWGAWLNGYPDKIIVEPKEWIRPGHAVKNEGLKCPDRITLRTCRPILDDFRVLNAAQVWQERLKKAGSRGLRGNMVSLRNYVRNKFKGKGARRGAGS